MTITPTLRAHIEAEIIAACAAAKREFPKVGTAACPTGWDLRHAEVDGLLDELEAEATQPSASLHTRCT